MKGFWVVCCTFVLSLCYVNAGRAVNQKELSNVYEEHRLVIPPELREGYAGSDDYASVDILLAQVQKSDADRNFLSRFDEK